MMQCPCQSSPDLFQPLSLTYAQCCRPYHQGKAAATAEALMRSRYSAYVLNDVAYLHRTWSKQTRPAKKTLTQEGITEWRGLTVVRTEQGLENDTQGVVAFIAYYQQNGERVALHEASRFSRENGRWVYVDGEIGRQHAAT